ncbi:condensation domain-containing protein [Dactylosporangium cerinum]
MTELLTPVRVPFTGSRSGTGPLTWGQRAIWHAIGRTVPNDHYFNLDRIVDLGERTVPVPTALGALAALVARHEALRTRLGADPLQVLALDGSLDVHIVDGGADPAAEAGRVRDLLAGTAFDYRAEWPVRAALVTRDGEVSHLVLVLCHLATDGHGAEVLARDLRLLVRRGTRGLRDPETTPLDVAAEQDSPEGHRRGAAALSYWAEQFARIPATMWATPVAVPREPRYWTGRLVSTKLTGAVDALAAQHGVSGSTVLLTAAGALAAAAGGHPTTAVMPIVGNRFTTGHRDLVSTLSQDGLFVLDVDRPTFGALLRRAGRPHCAATAPPPTTRRAGTRCSPMPPPPAGRRCIRIPASMTCDSSKAGPSRPRPRTANPGSTSLPRRNGSPAATACTSPLTPTRSW